MDCSYYQSKKSDNEKRLNDFINNKAFFAFNDKQFGEGMKKLGLKPTDTDKIYRGGIAGMFYPKEYGHEFITIADEYYNGLCSLRKDDKFLYQEIYYELGNHEYGYTMDISETLDALELSPDDVHNPGRIHDIFEKARNDYLTAYQKRED